MTQLWFRMDADWLSDDKLIDLGDAYGPGGPLAFGAMLGAAKVQERLYDGERRGTFQMGYRQLARACFLDDRKRAQEIAALAAEVGLIEMLDHDDRAFTARVIRWNNKQRSLGVNRNGARRTALYRNKELRDAVRERDGDACRYCGIEVDWNDRRSRDGGTYDHVDPKGDNTLDNLVVACRGCNSRKGDKSLDAAKMSLRDLPRPTAVSERFSSVVDRSKTDLPTGTRTDTGTTTEASTHTDVVARDAASARVKPAKLDLDSLPDEFPEHLRGVLDEVAAVLVRVAAVKGAPPPRTLPLARAIAGKPQRDHLEAAHKLEHWLCFGTGQSRRPRDLVGYFRNQLDNVADRPRLAVVPDGAVATSPYAGAW